MMTKDIMMDMLLPKEGVSMEPLDDQQFEEVLDAITLMTQRRRL